MQCFQLLLIRGQRKPGDGEGREGETTDRVHHQQLRPDADSAVYGATPPASAARAGPKDTG